MFDKNKTPILSFITICYNGFNDTCELIESIQKQIESVDYEIIVVDNASKANEASILQQKYPTIHAIRSEVNLGFSGGNNIGIRQSKGDYLFLINNDTYIIDDTINLLIERLKNNPNIAALSPQIRYAIPPFNIQYAGYTPLTSITLRNKTIGNGETNCNIYDPTTTPFLHGAAMLVKREIIENVGLMPEIYFLYYEEIDWSTQMTQKGYELWYTPEWTIFHKESQSTGVQSKLQIFYMTRNRLLYAWRNRSGITKWLSIFYQIMIAAPKNSVQFIIKRRFDLNGAVLKGIWAFIFLPSKCN